MSSPGKDIYRLSILLRHAFMSGAGIEDGQKISPELLTRWQNYDPTVLRPYQQLIQIISDEHSKESKP